MKLSYTPKLYECTCCHSLKPINEFYQESYTDQRTKQCKECINLKKKIQRSKSKHGKFVSKEKIRNMEESQYTFQDWKEAMLHFRGACAFCGKSEGRARKEKLERDHLVAISRGGKTVRNNIVPACAKCNRGRGNRLWQEWFIEQPFYSVEREAKLIEWQENYIKKGEKE